MPKKNQNPNPNNHESRIVGKGVGLKSGTQPLSVRFPSEIMDFLKAKIDTQDFVRSAVVEKLERDASLPLAVVAIAPTPQPAEPIPKKSRAKKSSKQAGMPT